MPVWNWWELHKHLDLKYLLKDTKQKVGNNANIVLKKLQKEYYDNFGISDVYRDYLNKLAELECLRIDVALGDLSQATFVEVVELEVKDLEQQMGVEEVKGHGIPLLVKHYGVRINPKETSVYEFYSYVEQMKEEAKQMKSVNNGRGQNQI
jgi:hypothetical protein